MTITYLDRHKVKHPLNIFYVYIVLTVINHQKKGRLKPLLDKVPPGIIADTSWLRAQGDRSKVDPRLRTPWMAGTGHPRGVYRRPLPEGAYGVFEDSWEASLLSRQWIMKRDVHLGSESALDLAGYTHYISLGGMPRVHLHGSVPSWLKRLPIQTNSIVHRRTLFGDDPTGVINASQDVRETTHVVNVWRWPITTSSPERAILEALDELRAMRASTTSTRYSRD